MMRQAHLSVGEREDEAALGPGYQWLHVGAARRYGHVGPTPAAPLLLQAGPCAA